MGRQEADPYEILGLEQGATWAEIRVAYRRLAKKHHPDKNPGDKTSEWIFKEVGRAYEHLRGVHGVNSPAGERRWRERDSGGPSDAGQRERQAKEQREREQRERAERVRREQERAERREREQREKEQATAARERWERAKSERQAQASRGTQERGWRSSSVRPRVGIFAALAVAVLIGVATTIYDRTGDVLSDRASQSVTESAREAVTARRPGTDPARQMPVPVARGSGSSRASVRVGTDVNRSRGPQSATEVEHEAATARPRPLGAATPRQASVGQSRAPERANASSSGALPPSDAQVANAPVIGWRAIDLPDRNGASPHAGANVTGSAFFTRGSHEDEVLRIQGTPTDINKYPALGHETWKYGRGAVTISTGSRRVTEWSNPVGNLKVQLLPGPNVTGSALFTRGSHEDEVLRIQGTPTGIDRYPALGHETWKYSRGTVTISTGSRRVTEWSNPVGNLKVQLLPGPNVTGSAFFTRGSHEDEVLRIQGTPTGIDRYPALGHETWKYSRGTVTISTGSRRVTEWSNPVGNLKVQLLPGPNVTGSALFTRGSHEDEVLRIQGTPTGIDRYPALGHETWKYSRGTVTISTGSRRVTEWSNPVGNLKVQLLPGPNVTGSAFFTRGSHEDEVLRIQGTPTGIDRYPALEHETWKYSRGTVTISTGSRRVTEWSNPAGNLQVR